MVLKGIESTLAISPSFKRRKREVGVVVERAVFHLSRQNETKRKRLGEKKD